MREFPRLLSKQIGRLIPANRLFSRNTPVFLPFYHVASNVKLPHIFNYPYRTVKQLEKELDFFLKYFKPVSLQELLEANNKKEQIFHLTFDDGLKESSEIIAPLLISKGIPATFFVNTSFVDNRELFHKYKAGMIFNELRVKSNDSAEKILVKNNLSVNTILKAEYSQRKILDELATVLGIDFQAFLKTEQPYLTTKQIKQLHSDGFSIGAHSADHPEFYKIPVDEQLEQIRKSMQWITENVQPQIRAFSFPFTDSGVPGSVLQTIKDEKICDMTFGTAGLKYDSFDFHFQRYPMEQPGDFYRNLKGEFVYFELRKLMGKAKVTH